MSAGAENPLAHVIRDAMASASHDVAAFVRELKALDLPEIEHVDRTTAITGLTRAAEILRRGAGSLLKAAVLFELVASATIEEDMH